MEGEGIQGKSPYHGLRALHTLLLPHLISCSTSPRSLLCHSELPVTVNTPSILLPLELEHAVLFALSPVPSNNNRACSPTSSDCHLNSTFLQIIAISNKQESFFTLYHFTILYFSLWH